MSEEWGPWIEHDQSGVPNEVLGRWIEVICLHPNGWQDQDEFKHPDAPLSFDWEHVWLSGYASKETGKPLVEIVMYRIRKPRGMAVLEEISNGVREDVDA